MTVAAVARRLGVAPATLRTWARRYGLGPSHHTAGSHRRYTQSDVARLVVMRRLTHEGLSPSQAAQFALDGTGQVDTELTELDIISERAPRAGGGRVVPLREASPAARGLARASMTLDALGVTEVLRRQISADGVVHTWESLITPVLIGLGERYASTGQGIEVEHLFSSSLNTVLAGITMSMERPRFTPRVLLACPPEEQHSLPLLAVEAALAERGVLSRQLGMRVPHEALLSATRRTGPGVVLLYASMAVPSHDVLAELAKVRPVPRVLIGGPGWGRRVPTTVTRVESLSEAVEEIIASIL
jgi:hypothetical protein